MQTHTTDPGSLRLSPAQLEAIAQADAALNNAAMPTYTAILEALEAASAVLDLALPFATEPKAQPLRPQSSRRIAWDVGVACELARRLACGESDAADIMEPWGELLDAAFAQGVAVSIAAELIERRSSMVRP